MVTRGLLLFLSVVLPVLGAAQSNGTLRRQAILAEMEKDWYSAAQYYQRLFFRDSTNLGFRYSYAENSRKALDNEVALRLYTGLAAVDNGRRFPLSFYWIGHCLKTKGNYRQAKLWFQKFLKLKKRDEELNYYRMRAKQEVEHCDYASILVKRPVSPAPVNVASSVNTRASEYAPYEMDSTLYYSSIQFPDRRDPRMPDPQVYGKVYRANIRKGRYMKSYALDTVINANRTNNANLSYTPSKDFMVMSRCVALNFSDYQCDLYSSKLVSKRWQVPSKMEEPVNMAGYSTTQPHLAVLDSQLFLFFSSNRPGGQGGMDIWYVTGQKDGTFSAPVNAGKTINSPEDEVTPWFVPEEGSLYFSSTYHGGLGGFDVFRSRYSGGAFAEAVNAGYPLNTGYNDVYYSVNASGKRAYVSSNRPGSYSENKNNCCNDIYMFDFDTVVPPPVTDTTFLLKEKMKLLVPLTLFFHNDEPDPKTTNTVTAKSYDSTFSRYIAMLPEYEREFSADLKKTEKQLAGDVIQNFFNDSVAQGMEELRRFVDLMKPLLAGGDTVKITMKGYCSPLASTNYNRNLARRRISSLRNYFRQVDNGVLLPYIEGRAESKGSIIFEDVDIGELKASKASDSFRDRRNSIYSPYAAAERKIQIIAVSFGGGL